MLELTALEAQRKYCDEHSGQCQSNVKMPRDKGVQSIRPSVSRTANRRGHRAGTDACYCEPGTKAGYDHLKCSGCQNNIRRAAKQKGR